VVVPGDIGHSEVGVVAEEALKVAMGQEGLVSAVDPMEVVVVSEGHRIAFDIRV
jgi:hypothetical protein